MNAPDNFEMADGYACFRAKGQFTFQQATELIADAIVFAADQKIRKLLVETTQLTGFESPTTLQRIEMVERWVRASNRVKIAIVARPELMDPERFGVTAAQNRGLIGNVFSSEPEAVAWLLGRNTQ